MYIINLLRGFISRGLSLVALCIFTPAGVFANSIVLPTNNFVKNSNLENQRTLHSPFDLVLAQNSNRLSQTQSQSLKSGKLVSINLPAMPSSLFRIQIRSSPHLFLRLESKSRFATHLTKKTKNNTKPKENLTDLLQNKPLPPDPNQPLPEAAPIEPIVTLRILENEAAQSPLSDNNDNLALDSAVTVFPLKNRQVNSNGSNGSKGLSTELFTVVADPVQKIPTTKNSIDRKPAAIYGKTGYGNAGKSLDTDLQQQSQKGMASPSGLQSNDAKMTNPKMPKPKMPSQGTTGIVSQPPSSESTERNTATDAANAAGTQIAVEPIVTQPVKTETIVKPTITQTQRQSIPEPPTAVQSIPMPASQAARDSYDLANPITPTNTAQNGETTQTLPQTLPKTGNLPPLEFMQSLLSTAALGPFSHQQFRAIWKQLDSQDRAAFSSLIATTAIVIDGRDHKLAVELIRQKKHLFAALQQGYQLEQVPLIAPAPLEKNLRPPTIYDELRAILMMNGFDCRLVTRIVRLQPEEWLVSCNDQKKYHISHDNADGFKSDYRNW